MTQIEMAFYNTMINTMNSVAKSLEKIAKNQEELLKILKEKKDEGTLEEIQKDL